jgi:hypothetical protein
MIWRLRRKFVPKNSTFSSIPSSTGCASQFGAIVQALTIFGYVAFVASLQTVIRALAQALG